MSEQHATAFANRLRKNLKHLRKWQKRTGNTCFRVYDADLPDYAFAIDIYNDWAHIQEYAPPKTVDQQMAEQRRQEVMTLIPNILEIQPTHCVFKTRQRQKGLQQYQLHNRRQEFISVYEGRAQFLVNLHDYLDTGLFLDHRPLRLFFSESMQNKRFLNCFCYTATVSVQAALGGAITTNVDLSKTYLKWAKNDFDLNDLLNKKHRFIQADCLDWLAACEEKFDVIFLDPPSFSNSKRMQKILDVQRDHVGLIEHCMRCLATDGVLYFSNNFKKFRLDESISKKYRVKDITKQTIDEDFKYSKNIHHCFRIESR